MLEEIYCSRFQSLCRSVFIDESASGCICGTWLLPASVSTDAFNGNEHSNNWDTCNIAFTDISAGGSIVDKEGYNYNRDTHYLSSTCTTTDISAGGKHNYNRGMLNITLIGTSARTGIAAKGGNDND